MLRKMMLMALSVGALIAFAAPAVAQADVTLTEEGVNLEVGAEVTATSENLETTVINGGILDCTKVTLHFEVTENGAEHVTLARLGNATTEHCTALPNGLPATIQNGGVTEELTINTWGTANVNATFISQVFLDAGHTMKVQECDYAGNLHVLGKGSGTDEIEITNSALTAAGCNNATIEGDFTLETSNGVPVELDYEETP